MENSFCRIKTLIVDDEQYAREGISILLQHDLDIELIGESDNGIDAVELIKTKKPDLLFLDIQMPKLNGFQVLESLKPNEIPLTVFVTSFDKFALKAFEVNAIDYLLKPFDDDQFYRSLQKAKQFICQQRSVEFQVKMTELLSNIGVINNETSGNVKYIDRLVVKDAKGMIIIKTSDIDWILADDYYAKIVVKNKIHLLRESLNELEKRLNPNQFIRIHRSTIINIDRIQSIQHYSKNDYIIITQPGDKFMMSRLKRDEIFKHFGI
ncbi:MAG: hypothetical protein A2W99_14410 [Bacteroidetes bacterium GWF2_33_16]|nr:MAG: hypothetical protein A2X00_08620 [Bacteroidetes bacterium GWE2_32_14]OFY04868.1 MAG: hypothetical protein A2W99_14410 [Bacteroidetes bacterium GWF2_33_16]